LAGRRRLPVDCRECAGGRCLMILRSDLVFEALPTRT